MAKDSFEAWRAARQADALDVLKLEEQVAMLEAQKAAIEGKTFVIPGQRRKAVDEVQTRLARLRLSLLTVQEQVAANAEQTAILEREREFRRKKKAEEDARKPEAVERRRLAAEIGKAARDGLPETEGTLPPAKPAKPDRMADFAAKSDVEKQKIQSQMLETPSPGEGDPFDPDGWLEQRRLKMEQKRRPKF